MNFFKALYSDGVKRKKKIWRHVLKFPDHDFWLIINTWTSLANKKIINALRSDMVYFKYICRIEIMLAPVR